MNKQANIHPSHKGRIERELSTLQALAKKFNQDVDFTTLGTAGYVARMIPDKKHKQVWSGPVETAPIVMADADDTFLAYNMSREPRMQAFIKYAGEEINHQLNEPSLRAVMEMADTFSRWKDWGVDADLYHVDAHLWALDWVSQQLKGTKLEDVPDKLREMQARLDKIKAGLGGKTPDRSLPFAFDYDELVLGTFKPSPEMMTVFEVMYEPELYKDTLSALQEVADAGGQTVIYTYGEPLFQMEKFLRLRPKLAAEGQEWPFEYVFLARKRKGVFLEELFESANNPKLHEAFFGRAPHVLMLMDDDKKECDDFLRIADSIEAQSGARFCTVHLLRDSGKTWKNRHEVLKEDDKGLVVDEHERRGVFMHGETDGLHAHLSEDLRKAHAAAYANLRLRVYKVLANNLNIMIDRLETAEFKSALESQRQYFTARAHDVERTIEKAYNLHDRTL
jgi:hypothetical protein